MVGKQNPERRREILLAAAEEFAAKGYHGTSYASIGERAGLHRNALQNYFPSKPDLAAEIAWAPFRNGQFLAEDTRLTGGIEAILALLDRVAHEYITNVIARASMRLMNERDLVPANLPIPFGGWLEPVRCLLEEAIQAGDLRPDTNADELAWSIVCSFAGARLVSEVLDQVAQFPDRALLSANDLLNAHRY